MPTETQLPQASVWKTWSPLTNLSSEGMGGCNFCGKTSCEAKQAGFGAGSSRVPGVEAAGRSGFPATDCSSFVLDGAISVAPRIKEPVMT